MSYFNLKSSPSRRIPIRGFALRAHLGVLRPSGNPLMRTAIAPETVNGQLDFWHGQNILSKVYNSKYILCKGGLIYLVSNILTK